MPLFVLLISLLVAGSWLTEVFILIPLKVVAAFSLPNWLILAAITLVVCWCFGE